ncbi:MAG: organic hydroperoxide resistance protein [Phenylobacterium sp.]|uniref:organic hydroperoxide resistance protein n=1 Tax=Phenylobacterium sp. TaxID=1871053 RepID=UPI001B4E6195|nr:organic hydroperoxide resistance protein [Phenylobacterium sp.]MBP7650344.1 organic hydroperoxide resistance protein [Phenylobacterium sp.]MBP7815606.1 organic hydroperoxide resistance protein [Phenylobacterium sp.]MBP9231690.1 organic hydroperoxide resistance protein [Phenylobacterium sp.]MBP9755574.1 organic hydroperoxide resistance protein [Phenylobacterium sp.]
MSALYSTQARAVGGRAGHVETTDGLLKVDLALPKEMGGKGGATNPEQLFAAGYAACFENAVRFLASQQKIGLTGAAVTSTVELHPRPEGGFRLGVALDVETQGLEQTVAETLVAAAHQVCPYSNAVRGNVDVAITVRAQ